MPSQPPPHQSMQQPKEQSDWSIKTSHGSRWYKTGRNIKQQVLDRVTDQWTNSQSRAEAHRPERGVGRPTLRSADLPTPARNAPFQLYDMWGQDSGRLE